MTCPDQSAELTAAQIQELNQQLATMRHDINNHLSLVMAAVELVRRKPEAAERMAAALTEQPAKIIASMKLFSAQFESALGIQRS